MNQAPIHSLCLLYQITGRMLTLDMALTIEKEFEIPPAGDYLRGALAGKAFHELAKPRWESLHPIMGLAELYLITSDDKYRNAFQHLWWSMVEGDRHNNGGFSSEERATGNPYDARAIETCCTIAWMAMSVEMLRLSGDSVVADELELSLFNSGLGMMSPSGRWVTYNTPMSGVRQASAHEIAFQAKPGTPELNCCSVNGPRALGLVSDWAVMRRDHGLVLNYYGPSRIETALPSGRTVRLTQQTNYPRDANVTLIVEPEQPERFALALRVPYWSADTTITLNGQDVDGVAAGEYLHLDREWQQGDRVDIAFDFSCHYWYRQASCIHSRTALASIYRGPILLTYDPRFNDVDPAELPALEPDGLAIEVIDTDAWLKPWMLFQVRNDSGEAVCLCDFASAGAAGNTYESWLPVHLGANAKCSFSRNNPLRSYRP